MKKILLVITLMGATLLFAGPERDRGTNTVPFGQGLLCMGKDKCQTKNGATADAGVDKTIPQHWKYNR